MFGRRTTGVVGGLPDQRGMVLAERSIEFNLEGLAGGGRLGPVSYSDRVGRGGFKIGAGVKTDIVPRLLFIESLIPIEALELQ